jgi:hypothetical protein
VLLLLYSILTHKFPQDESIYFMMMIMPMMMMTMMSWAFFSNTTTLSLCLSSFLKLKLAESVSHAVLALMMLLFFVFS